jgi:hypothetical protein
MSQLALRWLAAGAIATSGIVRLDSRVAQAEGGIPAGPSSWHELDEKKAKLKLVQVVFR